MSAFERFQRLVPSWLSTGDGGKALASLMLLVDDYAARAKFGLLARFPSYAPDDATLAAIGRDRLITRGINEPAAAYVARLKRAPDDLQTRGSPPALLKQLQAYLQAQCAIRIVDRSGNWWSIDASGTITASIATANWNWDALPASPYWSRFWVIIYPVGGTVPWAPSKAWGAGALWGTGKWGVPGATIGTTATSDQVAAVRGIIRQWKAEGTTCEWIVIAFDSTSFSPAGSTNPAGGWGEWTNSTGQPVRLSTARYWKGTSP